MSATNPVTPEPRRFSIRLPRPLWIGLTTVVVVIVGIGLAVWLPYHREQQVIQMITGRGGRVGIKTRGPEWVRRIVGDDCLKVFDRVGSVNFESPTVSDSDLWVFSELKDLEWLDLSGTNIGDAGIVHLSRLTNLKALFLNRTAVTDAGLPRIGGLTNLKGLILDHTAVTDAGLAHLSGLTNLEQLFVGDTQVSDEGVDAIQKALPDCKVTMVRATHDVK